MGVPHIVVVGGGFAGLAAARGLARAPVRITLIDRRNHHLFQPLLYQVATAMLSPADIAQPIRHILARQRNVDVVLAEVARIDANARSLTLADGTVVRCDALVLATGATHSYFGHDAWAGVAPGLKTVEDAIEIRKRFLLAFEHAEREHDEPRRRAALTFVIVGAGPTGVELAGAMMEIARRAIPHDFRHIDTATARVILIEAQDHILPAFDDRSSARALSDLARLGVETRLNQRVVAIDKSGVTMDSGQRIDAHNVIWAAGVKASPLGAQLGVELDPSGRVPVEPDLSVRGHPDIFIVGDLAKVTDPATGNDVPGMAPGALQMGRHVARVLARRFAADAVPPPNTPGEPFRFKDKGQLATIGRGKAVALIRGRPFAGWLAWWLWALVHVYFLIGLRSRVAVMLQWAWSYVTFQRGARLITGSVGGSTPETAP